MLVFKNIHESLLISEHKLANFAATAPHRYKVYEITKRSGTGTRTIAHPSKELKFIQRMLVALLDKFLPVHSSAYAYKNGLGIKDNAARHLCNDYLLKMDLKDFFPSITPAVFFEELTRQNISFSDEDILFLNNILFWKRRRNSILRLSIGAPSSPLISNFVMFTFDSLLSQYCESKNITYTRYADDLTFSTNEKNILFDLPRVVNKSLKLLFKKQFKVNKEKTVFTSKAHNRHVTGVTLTNEGLTSLGREKKRVIFSMVHHYSHGTFNQTEIEKLKGIIAYAVHIDSKAYMQLVNKYGLELISTLIKRK